MLKFTFPEEKDIDTLTDICKDIIKGTEAYTELKTGCAFEEGAFIVGKDNDDNIRSLVYNNGDGYIAVFGEEFPDYISLSHKCIMTYNSLSAPDASASVTDGTALIDFFRLITESDRLSFDDERRYCIRRRRINKNFAAVFCIYDNGKPVSSAAISATNDRYALIADVFTKKEFRGRHLAAECIGTALSYILKKNRIPFLLCDEDLCGYYINQGFTYYGKL